MESTKTDHENGDVLLLVGVRLTAQLYKDFFRFSY